MSNCIHEDFQGYCDLSNNASTKCKDLYNVCSNERKSFIIYIKFPFPASDLEDQVEAKFKEEAAKKFKERYKNSLIDFSEKDLLEFIVEE
jgi:hypothetical protein